MANCTRRACALAGAFLVSASVAIASDLNPPVGPIADTGPTQIFELPFVINTPGAYIVAENLTGPNPGDGVTILASDVVLDLGGHTLTAGAAPSGDYGIFVDAGAIDVTVRNGSLVGWFHGVRSDGISVDQNLRVEDLRIRGGECGILIFGDGAVVSRCHVNVGTTFNAIAVTSNARIEDCTTVGGSTGIIASRSSTIINCTASGAGGSGISALQGSVIENCVARDNTGSGITIAGGVIRGSAAYQNGVIGAGDAGLSATNGGTIIESVSRDNNCSGVLLSGNNQACSVINTIIVDNQEYGVRMIASGGSVVGCTLEDNLLDGVLVGSSSVSLISDCLIRSSGGNGVAASLSTFGSLRILNSTISRNTGHGVDALANTTIESCTIQSNQMYGVMAGNTVRVVGSHISNNRQGGVDFLSSCSIINSTCEANGESGSGGANHGIHLRGNDNEVDSCIIRSNFGSGIEVAGSFCFVTRNRLHADNLSNTGGASNRIGTIVGTPVGAGPWDNFSF